MFECSFIRRFYVVIWCYKNRVWYHDCELAMRSVGVWVGLWYRCSTSRSLLRRLGLQMTSSVQDETWDIVVLLFHSGRKRRRVVQLFLQSMVQPEAKLLDIVPNMTLWFVHHEGFGVRAFVESREDAPLMGHQCRLTLSFFLNRPLVAGCSIGLKPRPFHVNQWNVSKIKPIKDGFRLFTLMHV